MSRKTTITTLLILSAIVGIFAVSLWLHRDTPEDSSFIGTDSAVTEAIESAHDYEPWFSSVFTPGSGEIESGLFALQAALGAGVFGFAIGALWQRRRDVAGAPDLSAKATTDD
ncbi:energy-coupling factor ABC transporter substrate-binding protein [Mycolicibacterium agri]|uniref:Cobalt transport protein CbiN n=1 Tax=Mycolicibacterium agri TaxID=36811 RepID=A0A2A7MNJ3_MYCAG|nr:energy-coupling factor ABC transporter substrate-binding protein [Mycolicibacterium agri]PEG33087.1 energy-coupling factor ABC transporter substrate-binding protein [Mycolicibacterium agri]GFG54201.1 cobalt transport protein CbiN [Mycolicibacterium agri]